VQLSHKNAGILSTVFDIGGVIGGVLAGVTSDIIAGRGVTSIVFLLLSIPSLLFYRIYGSVSMFTNIALMLISGALVNGPYSLITTAVSADLGTQSLIKGNSRALATVSAIIDGTGSVGAAFGPLLGGYISTRGWNRVFGMLVLSLICFNRTATHPSHATRNAKRHKNDTRSQLNSTEYITSIHCSVKCVSLK